MTHSYTQALLQSPQSLPAFGEEMIRNNAGGYVFQVSSKTRLDRFLILGSEAGSYYCGAREMTLENASTVKKLIEKQGVEVVRRTLEISQSGRAPKNDPALFVLALCLVFGDLKTKNAVKTDLHKAARISTHLFLFLEYCTALRGWGRAFKTTVARWYERMNASELAFQTSKYRSRGDWAHHDVLNLAHVKAQDEEKQSIFHMIINRDKAALNRNSLLKIVNRCASRDEMAASDYYKLCANATRLKEKELISAIRKFGLPHEVLPSESLTVPDIWKALLDSGLPMTALIRNIGRMAALKIFKDASYVTLLRERLLDPVQLEKARIHPLTLLTAWKTYSRGCGNYGNLCWDVDTRIRSILEKAFYLAFKTVKPTGKRIFIGLDVSSSMEADAWNGLTAMEISSVMCMAIARTEPNYTIKAFSHELQDVRFGENSSLDEVLNEIKGMEFGYTDCSLPMLYAREHKIAADAFIIYTDNETWYDRVHPFQALRDYRKATGIDAKLIVVGITATDFSIANPSDKGMLDVVGFDSSVPQIIGDFVKG